MHPWRTACLFGGLLAALAACDDGTPVERGFRSRQLVSIRDASLSLGFSFGSWSSWLYSVGGNYWLLDLETGQSRDVGPQQPPYPDTSPPDARYTCITEYPDAFTITDTQTGAKTVIDRLAWPACPTDGDPTIHLWRSEPGGNLSLWTGPYNQIAPVALDVTVRRVLTFVGTKGADEDAFLVLASRPSQPDGIGLFSVALRDYTVATVIPPTLGTAAWATGATGAPTDGSLASTTLSALSTLEWIGPGRYLYERVMKDGEITRFAGPFSDGPSELALFRQSASAMISRLLAGGALGVESAYPIWWYRDPGVDVDSFATWDDRRRRVHNCRSPFPRLSEEPRLFLHPAGKGLAFTVTNDTPFPGGPLLMMGAETCTLLADASVTAFGFSPDGTATAWLVQPLVGDATLWTGGPDGSAPRVIGTGAIAGPPKQPFFVGPSDLLLYLLEDLAWIDVHDDPVRLHYVAERVFGDPSSIGLGTDWLLTGHDRSSQDANGTLGLIQFRTGAKRFISREVVSYGTAYQSRTITRGGDYSLRVVYIVRGRNPSAQDGIWMATINSTDLD